MHLGMRGFSLIFNSLRSPALKRHASSRHFPIHKCHGAHSTEPSQSHSALHCTPGSKGQKAIRLGGEKEKRGRRKRKKMATMAEKEDKSSTNPRSAKQLVLGSSADDDNASSSIRNVETLLRVVPMGLCLAALILMIKNSISNDYGSVSYSNIGGFKYLVYANGSCALYSLGSAFYVAFPGAAAISRAWTLFLLDQVLTYVVLAAGAVSAEVLYLASKGDTAITWSEACGSFGPFCHKATASVGMTFGVVLCYIALSLISSYRLFSSYDPPICFPRKDVEVVAFPG